MTQKIEHAFLPAALELQATPPSPAGRSIAWTIMLFFVLGILWACIGSVDIVSIGQGKIIASGRNKTLQPLEIGKVAEIKASNGQPVKAGETLLILDDSSARADVDRLEAAQTLETRRIARYRQLATWLAQEDSLPTTLSDHADDPVLDQQWQEFQDRLAVIGEEIRQKSAEKHSAQQQVEKLRAVLPIITNRAKSQRGLAAQKLLPEQQYLEIEQARIETQHDLKTVIARVDELDAAVRTLEAQAVSARSEYLRRVLEQLEAAEEALSRVSQEQKKAENRLQATFIRSPADGVVQELAVHHVGAVVTPAQALMVVVPDTETLEVEAVLENKDIGFVEINQQVEVKIDTFPFTRYGTIGGRVAMLSTDAVQDENKGLVYTMRVLLERSSIDVNGRAVSLTPGMTVTVESKTGTRRLIEFFLSPLLRYADESVRER